MKTEHHKTRPHLEILDGLRGVGATMILIYHLFETYSNGPAFQHCNHGYLAVDFFFMLSGFVTAYAYDNREMSFSSFIKRRIIRLHPLVLIGNLIGLLFFYFQDDERRLSIVIKSSVSRVLFTFLHTSFLIPVLAKDDIRGDLTNYPLNSVYWTLALEYLMNIFYFFVLKKIGVIIISILMILSGALLLTLTLNLDPFNLFGPKGNPCEFTVIGGWSTNPEQTYVGLSRLLFPFFCGLIISRRKSFFKVKYGFFWSSLILVVALAMPRVGMTYTNGIYESIVIMVLFPLIIKIGAGSKIRFEWAKKLNRYLGEISYPLYATHYPLVYMQWSWQTRHRDDLELSKHIFVACCIFILSYMVAYSSLKLYDEPVRAYLMEKISIKNIVNKSEKSEEVKDCELKENLNK